MDYQLSDKWRMFGRWSVNNFGPEDRGDWTYETARGLNLGGLVRNNKGGNVDVVYTQSATTLWDLNIAINQFREGSIQPKAREYKPSDLGLPAYLDQKAGDLAQLPQMAVGGLHDHQPRRSLDLDADAADDGEAGDDAHPRQSHGARGDR